MLFCRGMAALPLSCILKFPAGLSRPPRHEVVLLEVKAGAGMDKESDRKSTQRGEDALAHTSILPGHHSVIL